MGSQLAEGTILGGDFSIVRPLGSGGMGAVYVALQQSTNKLRALKVMHRDVAPNEEMQRRFEQEARVGSQIKSGHVVEVVAAGHDGPTGLSYLVMELLEGEDLASHLRKHGSLLLFDVARIFEQLCHGVAAAHAASIVHRDLKPENIFLARSHQAGGAAAIVKILDFGIAKFVSEQNTHVTSAIGSPMWMAPEQTEPGPVTPSADVWALGLIAYTLLTGQFFWKAARSSTGTPMYLLREIVLETIPAASERGGTRIPPGFDAWFARCVARDPRDRYADAGLAWRGMQEFVGTHHSATGQPVSSKSLSGRAISYGPEAMAETSAADAPIATRPPVVAAVVPAAASQGVAPLPTQAPTSSAGRGGIWSKVSIGLAILVALLLGRSFSGKPETVAAPNVMPVAVPPVPLAPPPPRPPRAPSSGPTAPPHATRADPDDDDDDDPTASRTFVKSVRDHQVRLFPRLVKNGTNIADSVLVNAVVWDWYRYLDCYKSAFGPIDHLPDGSVTVGFDLLDMLPRHTKLLSSTFKNAEVEGCLVRDVTSLTINGAGSKGVGPVEFELKFQAN